MSSVVIRGLARSLMLARATHNTLPQSFTKVISTVEEGYEVQKEIIQQSKAHALGKHIGWKVGATNDAAKKSLGFGPFYGPLFESSFLDGKSVSLSSLGKFRAVEPEIGLSVNADFPPLENGKEYSAADVWARVEHICPSVEFAAARAEGVTFSPPFIVADFAFNGCVIRGSKLYTAGDFSDGFHGVARIKATLEINGKEIGSNLASSVLSNPVYSLTWLVNELNKSNMMLKKGDFVMTGAIMAHSKLNSGDTVVAKFTV